MEPNILFEDESFIVIDKPAGLIVHDGEESVAGWLKRHDPKVANLTWPDPTRAGIVHRLDRQTSGVMVVAKTPEALAKLQDAFREYKIKKVYEALVFGHPDPKKGSVDVAIGRHPKRKTPMTVIPVEEVARGNVRAASTDYKVVETFKDASLVEATMHTGRTHQVRLHLKYLGHPILGDEMYGTKPSERLSKSLGLNRQMLHAKRLGLPHPQTGEWVEFLSDVPPDFRKTLDKLQQQL